ncbi:MAG: DUF2513 domain-containing protein [Turicibacter sanguinis]|uniref:DUF2513 domain-containing protein n=1 Tax=Turicibacter sanguinis TaxID=154288 RepID=UPI002F933EE6
MRLNPDCIRDILLFVEENIDSMKSCVLFDELVNSLDKYDRNTLHYHVNQISKHDFVDDVFYAGNEPQFISDLSPKGHAFLANIRSNTTWNKTKEIASKVGSFSLEALVQIAATVISNSIA